MPTTLRSKRIIRLRKPDALGRHFIRVQEHHGIKWQSCEQRTGSLARTTKPIPVNWLTFLNLMALNFAGNDQRLGLYDAADIAAAIAFKGITLQDNAHARGMLNEANIKVFIQIMKTLGYHLVKAPAPVKFTSPCKNTGEF